MNKFFPPLAAVLLFNSLLLLNAQSSGGTGGSTDSPDSEKSTLTEKDLFLSTLGMDIQTAAYAELVAWCQSLGIDDTGSIEVLRQRLFAYYKVSPQEQEQVKSSKRIVIRSANSTEYFKIKEVDEDYIVLKGNVVIEFYDNDEGSTHIIKAHEVIINQTKKVLTALGEIEYTLIKKGKADQPEVFRGESFSFDFANWGGIFIKADGSSTREIEVGKKIQFYYSGDKLLRLDNDVVILDQGVITSSVEADPYWSIRASKIYVLGPGEWAIENAVLYIGNIPVFYLPFFFKPGDDFFFHPALGYRRREGSFLQTTIYFIGRKKSTESAFSFMKAAEGGETQQNEVVLEWLFLRQTDKIFETAETKVLKIMLDLYSRLGFFAGLVADFNPFWQFRGGIGFSRTIYLQTGIGYTPYNSDDLESDWNSSPFFSLELPFRFGFDTNFKITGTNFTFAGSFELYSDPTFPEDFYLRSEDIDWGTFLKGDTETTTATATTTATTTAATGYDLTPTSKTNLSWNIGLDMNFTLGTGFFKSLSFSNFDINLSFQSKTDDSIINTTDPARKFYYPTQITIPNASITLTGQIFNFSSAPQAAAAAKTSAYVGELYMVVLTTPAAQTAQLATDFVYPEMKENASLVMAIAQPDYFTITYSITPALLFEHHFNQDNWLTAADVDLESRYTSLKLTGLARLLYTFGFGGGYFSGSGSLDFTSTYKSRFNCNAAVDDTNWDAEDYAQSGLILSHNFSLIYNPLLTSLYFRESYLRYTLNIDLYKYEFDSMSGDSPVFQNHGMSWDAEWIKSHTLNNRFVFKPYTTENFVRLDIILPPLNQDYDAELNFTFWYLNSKISGGYKETITDEWQYKPLILVETLNVGDPFYLQQTLQWDLNGQRFERSITTAKFLRSEFIGNVYLLGETLILSYLYDGLIESSTTTLSCWGLIATFKMEQLYPSELNTSLGEWQRTSSTKELLPSILSLSYSLSGEPVYFWKDRVNFQLVLTTSWDLYLQEFTNSTFKFTFNLLFSVYRFLDFNVAISSYNNKSYRYIPAFADAADVEWVNPLEDLLRSFNFFNIDDRYASLFKLGSISISLIHYLDDWQLSFTYTGKQELNDSGTAYVWNPQFTITIQWAPIPEIKHSIIKDEETTNFRG